MMSGVRRAQYMTLETIARLSDDPIVNLPASSLSGETPMVRDNPRGENDPARRWFSVAAARTT